jgi:hypothetical protein
MEINFVEHSERFASSLESQFIFSEDIIFFKKLYVLCVEVCSIGLMVLRKGRNGILDCLA